LLELTIVELPESLVTVPIEALEELQVTEASV
jgi:hypothetical protein